MGLFNKKQKAPKAPKTQAIAMLPPEDQVTDDDLSEEPVLEDEEVPEPPPEEPEEPEEPIEEPEEPEEVPEPEPKPKAKVKAPKSQVPEEPKEPKEPIEPELTEERVRYILQNHEARLNGISVRLESIEATLMRIRDTI